MGEMELPAYLPMYWGVRPTEGATEYLDLLLTGLSALSTVSFVVLTAVPRVLRTMLLLAQKGWVRPFFPRVSKAEEVLISPGWGFLGGEVVSEKAALRLQVFWESKESHKIFRDSLMLGFLVKPKPRETDILSINTYPQSHQKLFVLGITQCPPVGQMASSFLTFFLL